MYLRAGRMHGCDIEHEVLSSMPGNISDTVRGRVRDEPLDYVVRGFEFSTTALHILQPLLDQGAQHARGGLATFIHAGDFGHEQSCERLEPRRVLMKPKCAVH